jgi:hypothetical protein
LLGFLFEKSRTTKKRMTITTTTVVAKVTRSD